MIIKDKIQIGGVWWDIFIVENLKDENNTPTAGLADLDLCFIKFDADLKFDALDEKFWHEINHILLDRGAGVRPNEEIGMHDERIIESVTPLLHQIMNQVIEWQVK